MASITNRSNFVVSVARRPELEKSFPYDADDKLKAYVKQLAMLQTVIDEWETSEKEPAVVGALSSGERAALFLAAKEEQRLTSPLGSFLMLENGLQKWVLRHRGMTTFIGTIIAGDTLF